MPSTGTVDCTSESTLKKAPRLSLVFTIHRFIAGGFGCILYFAPEYLHYEGFGRTENLPLGEKIALQSWGAFVIAVAIIVHFAQFFEYTAQLAIGFALTICFLLLVIKYIIIVIAPTNQANMPPEYLNGIITTGGIFFALLLLYVWGLCEKTSLAYVNRHFRTKRN